MFLAKDFIETKEGLVFAVVESGEECGKVLCFLRYIVKNSKWQKLDTKEANQYLSHHYPKYLHYSNIKQAHCHAVIVEDVFKHHQPRERLQNLLINTTKGEVETDLLDLCDLFEQHRFNLKDLGVTGSILIGAQKQSSDIDLVFYSREAFNHARNITQALIQQGDCQELSEQQWLESFDRRSCELSYSDYVWHEKRKLNKAIINQRKIDYSFVSTTTQSIKPKYFKKLRAVKLKVQILDDSLAFDYPAEFAIYHQEISEIVSYTATYTGQAQLGEWVEVAGMLEEDNEGMKRVVVGSSREAKGEYIKVIKNDCILKLPSFSAVIFDMDGLVLDTETTYSLAWQKAAKKMGFSFSDEFCCSLSGLHFQHMEMRLIDQCGVDFDLKYFYQLSGEFWRQHVNQEGIPVMKGVLALIKVLNEKNIPFCLATNSGKDNALECLALAELTGVFSSLITRDQVSHGKPEPDIFIAAAKALNKPINQCLVLEDSMTGILSASYAGAPCVYIPSVFPVDPAIVEMANCFLKDLNELAQNIH